MLLLSHACLCDPMDCSLPGSSVIGIFEIIKLQVKHFHTLMITDKKNDILLFFFKDNTK